MNKGQIKALNNEELMVHALEVMSDITKGTNESRGVSQKVIKDFRWTLEEVSTRFNLDLEKLKSGTQTALWWELDF